MDMRSQKHLGLSYYRENLAGASFVVVKFIHCSLGSFVLIYEFWHQFGSLVAFFLPRSMLKPILTVKKEKISFDSAP